MISDLQTLSWRVLSSIQNTKILNKHKILACVHCDFTAQMRNHTDIMNFHAKIVVTKKCYDAKNWRHPQQKNKIQNFPIIF